MWDSATTLSKLELSRSHFSASCPSLSTFFRINSWQTLSCEEVSDEDCCNHQAVLSLANAEAEVEDEGEQEMLMGVEVEELEESVLLLRLLLNLIFTDALFDMFSRRGCQWPE